MPLSVLALILAPFLAAPLLTDAVYRRLYSWEWRQITLDNAAILFGRGGRAALRELARAEADLRALDRQHHAAHACAPAPACAATDRALESAVRAGHWLAGWRARAAWAAAASAARAQLATIGGTLDALPALPVETVVCPVCGLPIGWRVRERPRAAARSDADPALGTAVEWLEEETWEYRLGEGS